MARVNESGRMQKREKTYGKVHDLVIDALGEEYTRKYLRL